MSLQEVLKELRSDSFSQMPEDIAKKIENGIKIVAQSQLKTKALKVGDKIPSFVLPNINNDSIDVKNLINSEYLVIDFYRGGWCPFCNMELREYERLKDEFAALKTNIVAISPERPEFSAKTSRDNTLSFEVLSDENSHVMKQFGIVFTLDDDVKEVYDNFGIDLVRFNGDEKSQMPIPATYVVNKDLEIVFAHVEEDYTTRCEPSKVLDFLKARV